MSFRVVLVCMLMVMLAGAVGVALRNGVSDFIDRVQGKQGICATLDDAERLDLVGVATPTKLLDVEGSLDPYTCRWATEDYTTVVTFVQAVSAPADVWAEQAGSTLMASARVADQQQATVLRRAAGSRDMTASEGCRVASVFFEALGARRGAKRVATPTTLAVSGAPMMMAQSCVDGTYTAVLVTAPGLTMDRSLARKTAHALRTVEERVG